MVPLQVALYVAFTPWLIPVYAAACIYLIPRTVLMLHNTMHRPFFRRPRAFNLIHTYLMTAVTGIPAAYAEHHIGMHHAENNLDEDLSSTMRYQRDSFFGWLRYVTHFALFTHFELTRYLLSRKRTKMAWRSLFSELGHLTFVLLMVFINPRAGLIAFVAPAVLVRALMMWGNWGQHAFIDKNAPGNSYVNSITCINSTYNRRCFNDGYHIGHHVKMNRHWTELPADFRANEERYAKEGSIVFEGIDFFMVSLYLFLGNYDALARRYVHLADDNRTHEEIVAHLKERVARVA